jgi:hypothetical protein
MADLQEVFAQHYGDYARGRSLHPRESHAAQCILKCYTAEAGSHIDVCPNGHYVQQSFHACRHRSCPRCSERPRQKWLSAELQRLLPCGHFHVVFTLPHELLGLWEFNRAGLTQLLFDCVRESLLQMLADPRHLGAMPGILMALHTWGRTLSHHPHVHALVTAGGLDAAEKWQDTRPSFLLPLKPLRELFAGKLLAQLREQLEQRRLALPPQQPAPHWLDVIGKLYRAHWNVQINPPYEHGRGVALYLARYAKGGPLPRSRELYCDAEGVGFEYRDHRDGVRKRLRLQAPEFIARVLWHAPPKGCHTVRHAGLYASGHKWQHCRARLALACAPGAGSKPPTLEISYAPLLNPCPKCQCTMLRTYLPPPSRQPRGEISLPIRRSAASGLTPSTEALGPTLRSSGHSTAGRYTPCLTPGSGAAGC